VKTRYSVATSPRELFGLSEGLVYGWFSLSWGFSFFPFEVPLPPLNGPKFWFYTPIPASASSGPPSSAPPDRTVSCFRWPFLSLHRNKLIPQAFSLCCQHRGFSSHFFQPFRTTPLQVIAFPDDCFLVYSFKPCNSCLTSFRTPPCLEQSLSPLASF